QQLEGKVLRRVERLGKRLVLRFGRDHYAIIHLMIAGRLHLKPAGCVIPKRAGLLAFDFDEHSLLLTEVSTQKRASLHLVKGKAGLREFDRGGLEPIGATSAQIRERLS